MAGSDQALAPVSIATEGLMDCGKTGQTSQQTSDVAAQSVPSIFQRRRSVSPPEEAEFLQISRRFVSLETDKQTFQTRQDGMSCISIRQNLLKDPAGPEPDVGHAAPPR